MGGRSHCGGAFLRRTPITAAPRISLPQSSARAWRGCAATAPPAPLRAVMPPPPRAFRNCSRLKSCLPLAFLAVRAFSRQEDHPAAAPDEHLTPEALRTPRILGDPDMLRSRWLDTLLRVMPCRPVTGREQRGCSAAASSTTAQVAGGRGVGRSLCRRHVRHCASLPRQAAAKGRAAAVRGRCPQDDAPLRRQVCDEKHHCCSYRGDPLDSGPCMC